MRKKVRELKFEKLKHELFKFSKRKIRWIKSEKSRSLITSNIINNKFEPSISGIRFKKNLIPLGNIKALISMLEAEIALKVNCEERQIKFTLSEFEVLELMSAIRLIMSESDNYVFSLECLFKSIDKESLCDNFIKYISNDLVDLDFSEIHFKNAANAVCSIDYIHFFFLASNELKNDSVALNCVLDTARENFFERETSMAIDLKAANSNISEFVKVFKEAFKEKIESHELTCDLS